jgi:hypothetical protein
MYKEQYYKELLQRTVDLISDYDCAEYDTFQALVEEIEDALARD